MKHPRNDRRQRATAIAVAASLVAGLAPAIRAQGNDAGSDRGPLVGHSPALRSKAPVTLNFVSADIEAVSRAMGAMLDRQFIVDPRVKGNITLYSEQPLTVREAYLNYLAALRGLGFTVVENGGLLKVVPEADAKLQTGTVTVGNTLNTRGDTILTQIFRLNHENVNSLVPVLRPLISPNNTINANPGSNTLVITDYADNLQRIARIIAAMDQPTSSDIEVIPLQNTVASDIAALVQRMADAPVAGVPGVPGVPTAGSSAGNSVIADPRSNSLIVRAANPTRMASIRAMVAKLDVPVVSAGPAGNIYVVYLKNADATKLAQVLRAAYGAGGSGSSSSTGSNAAGIGGLSTNALTAANPNTGGVGGSTTSPQSSSPVTPSAAPSTGGFVQADPATNSLIITAPEPVYRQLRSVIDQLDSRRAQVFIESMIVEMDAGKAAELGFQWQGLLGKTGDRVGLFAGTNFGSSGKNIVAISGAAATGNAGDLQVGAGLNLGLINKIGGVYTLGALARFLESNTGANILSTPNLVALDNEEAKFVNGQNVPFVTGQFTNTGGGNNGSINPFQTIERKDVGLTLRVRPQVGEGGKVRMTIFQENSSVAGSSSQATSAVNNGPTTNKSSIETTVEVEDGQIMVLGGLLKDQFVNSQDKVPVLGDVPVFGGLFRSESRDRRKTNLMVFLRPVVMRTGDDASSVTLDRYESIRAMQKDAQPAHSDVMGINESPVLPPMRPPAGSAPAASAPPAALSQPVPISEPAK